MDYLIADLAGITIKNSKGKGGGNWRKPDLTLSQIKYAARDAWASEELLFVLGEKVDEFTKDALDKKLLMHRWFKGIELKK